MGNSRHKESAPKDDGCQACPMIVARSISKSFGATSVLDCINLSVEAGAVVGLVGPNGVGKTTLLRVLAGILAPDKGTVKLCGKDIHSEFDQTRKLVGFVTEEPSLLEYLTAHELLTLTATLRGIERKKIKEIVTDLLAFWDLGRHEHELLKTFSHGMKQKVMILVGLLGSPPILLLDEPLTGLDIYSSGVLKKLLSFQASAGRAIIISSHSLSLVEDICDRLVILARRSIVFDGRLDAVEKAGSNLESFILSHAAELPNPSSVAEHLHQILVDSIPQ